MQPANHAHQGNISTFPISGMRAVFTLRRQNTLPIPAKHPNYDHNSHLGREQPHREGQNVSKKGAAGKYAEVMTGKAGGKFRPGRCEGLFYAEGQDFGTSRGAVGKRYERGLTCAAGHGVPGVLLPSQPRHARQPPKTVPRTHNFQAHIQASRTTRETLSPSQDKITLPIPAKYPNNDQNSHLGRAQPHREGENVTKWAWSVKDVRGTG